MNLCAALGLSRRSSGYVISNVYGPHERHKNSMASVAFHLNEQLETADTVRLFCGYDGYADGEQRRDFVHVDDAVAATLWFADTPDRSGIFNIGTGRSATFNEVAAAVLAWHRRGEIQIHPVPGAPQRVLSELYTGRSDNVATCRLCGRRTVGTPGRRGLSRLAASGLNTETGSTPHRGWRYFYCLLAYLLTPILVLRLIWCGRNNRGYWQHPEQRFGFVPKRRNGGPLIWVHAVSVGEVQAARPLIERLREQHAEYHIMVTTTTPTARRSLRGCLKTR